ncbi:hypothetical protein QFZ53_002824 [Microbacterium natoriense]|uniref:Uncharacterized protein n=1 Tax=Microbacterium natoriense TaxID=284570 RepID=A0AAW8EYM6_9MICO|nr:hypothetical protein [Microbacterium natoriense]MDQ0648628.1 hypothetical protein [Microbacterium natoriense]
MPIEVTLVSPVPLSVEEQREFAELLNPPLVAVETRGGGTVEFTELDRTRVLILGRPRRVETLTDLVRLHPDETREIEMTSEGAVMVDGVIPFAEYRRGLALVFAFEEATGGKAIVKGMTQ